MQWNLVDQNTQENTFKTENYEVLVNFRLYFSVNLLTSPDLGIFWVDVAAVTRSVLNKVKSIQYLDT